MLENIYRSNIVRSSGIYIAGQIINTAVLFLLIPVLTRFLTPADYGVVAIFQILIGVVSPFVGVNIHGAIGIKYFDKDKINLSVYIGNCFFILFLSFVVSSLIIWALANQINHLAAFPKEWLWAVVFCAAGQCIILILMTLWQVQIKPFAYVIYLILQNALIFGLSIWFVVLFNKGWRGRIEAQVIAVLIFGVLAFITLYKKGLLQFSYDKSYMLHALKFGLPLIPHALCGILIAQTDKLFIAKMVGIYDTGLYAVAYQIASVISLFAVSFNGAYYPWLYQKLKDNNPVIKRKIVILTYIYFLGVLIFALVLFLLTPWFLRFFVGDRFVDAGKYMFWLLMASAFGAMYYMVALYITYAEKNHFFSGITFIASVINIFLTYFLIRAHGVIGAAEAAAAVSFVYFILTFVFSAKCYKMPWNIRLNAVKI